MWISKSKWDALIIKVFDLEKKIKNIEKMTAHSDIPEWAERVVDEHMACSETNNQR